MFLRAFLWGDGGLHSEQLRAIDMVGEANLPFSLCGSIVALSTADDQLSGTTQLLQEVVGRLRPLPDPGRQAHADAQPV